MNNILQPYFSYETPAEQDEFDDGTNPDREEFHFYKCFALQDIGPIKKGDFFNWIAFNIIKKEIRGYRTISPNNGDDDGDGSDNDAIVFTIPFEIRLLIHLLK